MSEIIDAEVTELSVDERINRLEAQVKDLIAVMAGLNKSIKGLTDFINSIPNNRQLLTLIAETIETVRAEAEKRLTETGEYNFRIEWQDTPEAGCLMVECVQAQIENELVEEIKISLEEDGKVVYMPNNEENSAIIEFIENQFKDAGNPVGVIKYAKIVHD